MFNPCKPAGTAFSRRVRAIYWQKLKVYGREKVKSNLHIKIPDLLYTQFFSIKIKACLFSNIGHTQPKIYQLWACLLSVRKDFQDAVDNNPDDNLLLGKKHLL